MTLPALRCPRYGRAAEAEDPVAYRGCPACAGDGRAVAYDCDFKATEVSAGAGPGVWRWSAALPVDVRQAVSLGEGNTPLVRVPRVARDVGVRELSVKNEAANPTGSHKDRLAAVAVAAAREMGAEVVTGASIEVTGAELIEAPDAEARYGVLQEAADRDGWFVASTQRCRRLSPSPPRGAWSRTARSQATPRWCACSPRPA